VNEKNKNLIVRAASALLLLPVVLFLLARGGYYSALLMGVAAAVCTAEYYAITGLPSGPATWAGVAMALLLPMWPALAPGSAGDAAFWTVGAFFVFAWTYHLLAGPLPEAPLRSAHLVTGLLYGAMGLTALAALRLGPHGIEWVVCALVVTWANDTTAYFAGRLLGRHKLYPAVSPNKTWEGFVGGLVGSVVGLFLLRAAFFPELRALDCLVLGTAGGVLGPLGDLSESMLKRAYKVKDSGRIIPGHGGVLDRIDALLFNAPLVYLYSTLVRGGVW
jgi:phosphatidate cytidylyltransferase